MRVMSGIGTLSPHARRTLLLLFVSASILSALPLVARAGNGQVMTALVVSQVVVQRSPITPLPQPIQAVVVQEVRFDVRFGGRLGPP